MCVRAHFNLSSSTEIPVHGGIGCERITIDPRHTYIQFVVALLCARFYHFTVPHLSVFEFIFCYSSSSSTFTGVLSFLPKKNLRWDPFDVCAYVAATAEEAYVL